MILEYYWQTVCSRIEPYFNLISETIDIKLGNGKCGKKSVGPRSCYYVGLLHNTIFFVIWWISDVLEARCLWYCFDGAATVGQGWDNYGLVLLQDTSDGPTVDYLQHHDFAMWSRTEFGISRLEEVQPMDQCVMVSVKCTNQGTIVHLTQAPDFLHWPSSKLRKCTRKRLTVIYCDLTIRNGINHQLWFGIGLSILLSPLAALDRKITSQYNFVFSPWTSTWRWNKTAYKFVVKEKKISFATYKKNVEVIISSVNSLPQGW